MNKNETTRNKHEYSKWRHGGWYVHTVKYPSGAIGCVSNEYDDKKWRVACDPRPFNERPTFRTRDQAADAEAELASQLQEMEERPTPQEKWTVEPNADGCTLMVKRGPDARAVCNIWDDAQGRDDAALICAAHEMLRALEKAEALLRNIGNEDGAHKGYNAQFIPGVRNAIIEAISKAKGGA